MYCCLILIHIYFLLLGAAEGGLTRDEVIENVASDILKKLPKLFEIDRIKKAFQMNITPTGVVLLQELERFNKLLNRMLWTLSQLIRALAGEIGMDVVLDSIANSLFNGQLPDDWRKLAPQTCKQLGGWMEHLLVGILFVCFCSRFQYFVVVLITEN